MHDQRVPAHTPGPWEVDDGELLGAGGTATIARFFEAEDFPCLEGDAAEAFATTRDADERLIRTAPELLAALRETVVALAMCQPRTRHGDDTQRQALIAGRAALAKVDG